MAKRKTKRKKSGMGHIVFVTWIDSCATSGWATKGTVASATMCHSIGWLMKKDSESITVAGHLSAKTREYNGNMAIPRVAIKSLTRVRP